MVAASASKGAGQHVVDAGALHGHCFLHDWAGARDGLQFGHLALLGAGAGAGAERAQGGGRCLVQERAHSA